MRSEVRALVGVLAFASSLFAARAASACVSNLECFLTNPTTPICELRHVDVRGVREATARR